MSSATAGRPSGVAKRTTWKVTGRTIARRNAEKAFTFHHPDASFPSVLPRRETNERLTLLSAPSTSRPHLLQLRHRLLASQANVAVGSKRKTSMRAYVFRF